MKSKPGKRYRTLLVTGRSCCRWLGVSLLLFLCLSPVVTAEGAGEVSAPHALVLTLALAWLLPLGLTLLAVGGSQQEHAPDVAVAALAAVALSLLGYLVSGFAFQYGGLSLVAAVPGLERFVAEWSPFAGARSADWGIIGLHGFLLQDPDLDTRAYTFFLLQWLPALTATLIPLVAVARKVPSYALLLVALLVSGALYPLYGNWIWGGGWLAHLGQTVGWGHGAVDFAGSGTVFALGGGVALALLASAAMQRPRVKTRGTTPLPPVHFPLFMILGAFVALAGSWALFLANPLLSAADIHPVTVVSNITFAAAGGLLLPLLYTWFVAGRPDALMTARGLVAGLVAIAAGAAFVPGWAALATGMVAGALLPPVHYVVTRLLQWSDETAVAGTFVVPGYWGLLAVGLFASGRWGIGWNGTGAEAHLGVSGQGVSGYWADALYLADWPGQFLAQLAALFALLTLSFIVPYLLLTVPIQVGSRLWRARQEHRPLPATSSPEEPITTLSAASEAEEMILTIPAVDEQVPEEKQGEAAADVTSVDV